MTGLLYLCVDSSSLLIARLHSAVWIYHTLLSLTNS